MPVWEGRVSPVLDVAGRFLVVCIENGQETGRREVLVSGAPPDVFVKGLKEQGIEMVVCGSLSYGFELFLQASGIRVISHVCGEANQVLSALIEGRLDSPEFAMPGCWGRGRGKGLHRRRHQNRPWCQHQNEHL
ncbi:MAG: hypothetical protein M1608_08435 [Candidatus Omnitrophica bacterium]|nr:hypothetical protein [Candidatus Omnitrophota bacterium]